MASRTNEQSYEFCGPKHHCAYCGIPSDTIDHTIPVSFINRKPIAASLINLMKVSACRECNAFASDFLHETFIDRRHEIAKKVVRKYRKIIRTPPWTEDELDEMGPSMVESIRLSSHIGIWVRGRLANLSLKSMPEGVRNNLWEPRDGVDLNEHGFHYKGVHIATEKTIDLFKRKMNSFFVPIVCDYKFVDNWE